MLIPMPGSSPLLLSIVVPVQLFVPALAIPTLFIFHSSKMSLLLQMVYCYLVFLPIPIHPRPHHRLSFYPCPRHPPLVVDCCINFSFPFPFLLHFRLCSNFLQQFHNEREEYGTVNVYGQRTKGTDVDQAYQQRRAWTTVKGHGRNDGGR